MPKISTSTLVVKAATPMFTTLLPISIGADQALAHRSRPRDDFGAQVAGVLERMHAGARRER